MNLAIEMGSDVLIYMPSFIKIVPVTEKLIADDRLTDTQTHRNAHTHRQQYDLISILLFYKNYESRLTKNGLEIMSKFIIDNYV
jgi:hypothetical protein